MKTRHVIGIKSMNIMLHYKKQFKVLKEKGFTNNKQIKNWYIYLIKNLNNNQL